MFTQVSNASQRSHIQHIAQNPEIEKKEQKSLVSEEIAAIPFYQYKPALQDSKIREALFSNVVINPSSIIRIKAAEKEVPRKGLPIRFAGYAFLDLTKGKETTYLCFCPSLPSDATQEDEDAKNAYYNRDRGGPYTVVKSKPNITGTVHNDAEKIAVVEFAEELAVKIPTYPYEPSFQYLFELGLGLTQESLHGYSVVTRSTKQHSIQDLPDLVKYCFLFNPSDYKWDKEKQTFIHKNGENLARQYTNAFHVWRSLNKKNTDHLSAGIEKCLADYLIVSDASIKLKEEQCWQEKSLEDLSEWLLTGIYTLSFLNPCETGEFWTLKKDEREVDKIFDLAKKYKIPINVNKVPKEYSLYTDLPALVFALRKHNIALAELLLVNGAHLDTLASASEELRIIKINKYEMNLNRRCFTLQTQLLLAIESSNEDTFKQVISDSEFKIDLKNSDQVAFIFSRAFWRSNLSILDRLFSCYPAESLDLNKPLYQDEIPIFQAMMYDNVSLLEFLLTKGKKFKINFNQKDQQGDTPLAFAVRYEKLKMVEFLLSLDKACLDISIQGMYGETPFIHAVKRNYKEIVNLFLSQGLKFNMDINQARDDGETPLSLAVGNAHIEIVKSILSKSAEYKLDINKTREDGSSPLHLAIRGSKLEILELLLSEGVKYNIDIHQPEPVPYGDTLLSFALRKGPQVIDMIFSKVGDQLLTKHEKKGSHSLFLDDNKVDNDYISYLILKYIPPQARNEMRRTYHKNSFRANVLYQYAKKQDHKQIACLLKENSSNGEENINIQLLTIQNQPFLVYLIKNYPEVSLKIIEQFFSHDPAYIKEINQTLMQAAEYRPDIIALLKKLNSDPEKNQQAPLYDNRFFSSPVSYSKALVGVKNEEMYHRLTI